MALTIRRNGASAKSDVDRMSDIREKLKAETQSSRENADLYMAQLRNRIHKYERRYEMSSADMAAKLKAGNLQDTRDINLWFWAWQTFNRIKGETLTTGTH